MFKPHQAMPGAYVGRDAYPSDWCTAPAFAFPPAALRSPCSPPPVAASPPRVDVRCLRVEARARHDAATRTAAWLRGLVTVGGLAAAALVLWPSFAPAVAASPHHSDPGARAEFRSQAIAPLALGGDSGRRTEATAAVIALGAAPERPTVELTATLGQGDSFARMLQRAGVGGDEAGRIAAMVSGAVPLAEIEPGTRFALTLGRRAAPTRPRPVETLGFRARFELELAVERRGGALALVSKPIAVDATPLRVRGIVGASLYRSARAAGAPPAAVQQYLRALDRHLSLENDLLPSDEFDMVIGHQRAATGEVKVGPLLYAGVERNGRPRVQLLQWGGAERFIDADSTAARESALAAPVAGRITSGFGLRRHPILGYARMHAGVDFRAPYGAPIQATADGQVAFAGRHGGHGNYVRLAHGGGIGTGYGHMSRIAVAPGMAVRRGQVIGYVGSTGLSTGPHLHYELYRDGRTVNPGAGFVVRTGLDAHELAAFRARLSALRAVRPVSGAAIP